MNDKQKFEALHNDCLSEGIKILVQDIEVNKSTSDTINVMPLIDPKTGVILSSQTDQMLKQQGYIAGLNWVLGIIQYYQENEYQEPEED